MNFIENFKEAFKSIRDNKLRTFLTAAIVAIGITSLVGILTAVDAIQSSISSGLADLGANSFDIKDIRYRSRRSQGVTQSVRKKNITYDEAIEFKSKYDAAEKISLSCFVTGNAEVKYASKKTNPNTIIYGIDEYYLSNKGYDIGEGRGFSNMELKLGIAVAIISETIAETLFDNVDPINKSISIRGYRYNVIGVLKQTGGLGSGQVDRSIFLPVVNANRFSAMLNLRYTITTSLNDPGQVDFAIGEATGIMRTIRRDELGKENSFEISRSESVASSINETSGYLRIGGALIGLVTLLGASIGLMNIMMVSVTERTREIGVRKALGATPSRIREQFLVEAIAICLLGGAAGILIGIAIGNLVSLLFDTSAFVFPWMWIILGFTVCVIVGVLSGYYPAKKASKLDPIDSLRYE
ncbi:ABC transporter permease [Flammeovirgaceae bacterium SG7u.111]|nr:ABC transporter permease [Flammeovirgaceae bacterium SG7u.132]WPO33341.1 ABC transporter permease [Flammeovirgaceae bacterium SG7u.111]